MSGGIANSFDSRASVSFAGASFFRQSAELSAKCPEYEVHLFAKADWDEITK
jgi:hypothetical protein